jgi:CAAX amino terminal protease family.
MELFIKILLSSIIQIILASMIPLIWWLLTARKRTPFTQWIGLKTIKTEQKKKFIWITICISALFLTTAIIILHMVKNVNMATSQFAGLGIRAIIPGALYSFGQTAFSEEIFFRGFLGKRLIDQFGFSIGNFIQSLCFGLLHGLMFYGYVGIGKTIIIILFTGGIAWGMGYINEKLAGGSIWPSWFIHGMANLFSTLISLFNML